MASTTKIFRQSVTTGTLPDTMADGYKAWLGTWTVTSTSSEKSKTAYSFDIEIRPRTIDGTYYLVRGWGYTVIKDDYEVDANYVSSTKGFQLFKREVGTLGDGGALTRAPAYPQPPDKRLRAAQHECVPALRETGRGRQGQHHGP